MKKLFMLVSCILITNGCFGVSDSHAVLTPQVRGLIAECVQIGKELLSDSLLHDIRVMLEKQKLALEYRFQLLETGQQWEQMVENPRCQELDNEAYWALEDIFPKAERELKLTCHEDVLKHQDLRRFFELSYQMKELVQFESLSDQERCEILLAGFECALVYLN